MRVCHACQAPVEELTFGRRDECKKCGADLHACLNCRFHDAHVSRECREPQSEPPRDKASANFCEFFEFREGGAPSNEPSEAERAKAAFDALFAPKR